MKKEMAEAKEHKVVLGEILDKGTSKYIKNELEAVNTSAAQMSIRKSIVEAKDQLKDRVGMTTVIYALNRFSPVTENTYPVMLRLLEKAEKLEKERLAKAG